MSDSNDRAEREANARAIACIGAGGESDAGAVYLDGKCIFVFNEDVEPQDLGESTRDALRGVLVREIAAAHARGEAAGRLAAAAALSDGVAIARIRDAAHARGLALGRAEGERLGMERAAEIADAEAARLRASCRGSVKERMYGAEILADRIRAALPPVTP